MAQTQVQNNMEKPASIIAKIRIEGVIMVDITMGNTHIGMGGNPSNEEIDTMIKSLHKQGLINLSGGQGHGSVEYKMQVSLPNGEIGFVNIRRSSGQGKSNINWG